MGLLLGTQLSVRRFSNKQHDMRKKPTLAPVDFSLGFSHPIAHAAKTRLHPRSIQMWTPCS